MKLKSLLKLASLLLVVATMMLPATAEAQARKRSNKRKATTTVKQNSKHQNFKLANGIYQLTGYVGNKKVEESLYILDNVLATNQRGILNESAIAGGYIEPDGSIRIYEHEDDFNIHSTGLYTGTLTSPTTITGKYVNLLHPEETLNFRWNLKLLDRNLTHYVFPYVDGTDDTIVISGCGHIANKHIYIYYYKNSETQEPVGVYIVNDNDENPGQLVLETYDKATNRAVFKAYLDGEFVGTFDGNEEDRDFGAGLDFSHTSYKGTFTQADGTKIEFYFFFQSQPR